MALTRACDPQRLSSTEMTGMRGTLPRLGTLATADGVEEHAILVNAERGLLSSLAKQKVSSAKPSLGAFHQIGRRDRNDPSNARPLTEFGEGAAEVRALGEDGPGGKGVLKRLEGVAAMKHSRAGRHKSAVTAWETERDRVVTHVLATETKSLVTAFRANIENSDAKIAQIMDNFAPDVIRGEHVSTLRPGDEGSTVGEHVKEEEEEVGKVPDANAHVTAAKEQKKENAVRAARDLNADAVLAAMDADALRAAWETLRRKFPIRTQRIEDLETALTDASTSCSRELGVTFAR